MMLILSRKQNETIVIDGKIEIEVLKIKGNTIRLGIKAPRSVRVLRGELAPFDDDAKFEGQSRDENQEQIAVAEATVEYECEGLDRLPNPFAVAHAS
jgi:carbon storage regulator